MNTLQLQYYCNCSTIAQVIYSMPPVIKKMLASVSIYNINKSLVHSLCVTQLHANIKKHTLAQLATMRDCTISYYYILVISSVSITATEIWSTVLSIMVVTTPICFQPHNWIGVSSRSAGWAALIHMKSSNSAPGPMHCLAILYMEVAAGTDPCA